MDIIKSILGEADEPDKKKKPVKDEPAENKPKPEPKSEPSEPSEPSPESNDTAPEAQIDELANMWNQGNRDSVIQRFMTMDNETAVKVVFAIGREGALELARSVDVAMEQQGDQEGNNAPAMGDEEAFGGEELLGNEDSTEPASVEPADEGYPTRQILGV